MKVFLSLLLLLSVGLNAFFLTGKGINITHHHEQHQNQQQAQLVISAFGTQGRIEWKMAKPTNELEFLNTLAPEQALFAKLERGMIFYPEIQQDKEKTVPLTPVP